jgi:hypothetical protein
MRGVRWSLPFGLIYRIGKDDSRRRIPRAAAILAGVWIACVALFCGLDAAVSGAANAFTCGVVAIGAAALLVAAAAVYERVICKFVGINEFAEITLIKEKVFMLFVMVLEIPLLTFLLGFVVTHGLDTFLGWYGAVAAVALTLFYAYSFRSMIATRIESLFRGMTERERIGLDFNVFYRAQVKRYRGGERHLYEEYSYIGRYTEIFDLGHRFCLSIPDLGGRYHDWFLVFYIGCATVEILYCYFWWPCFAWMDTLCRLFAGFGHLVVAIDGALDQLAGVKAGLAPVGWAFLCLSVLCALLKSKVDAWTESYRARRRRDA